MKAHLAWAVVVAGGVAALQVGKLPPAVPALQSELGLSLVAAGFLLSMVQGAGLLLAVLMGVWADRMGLRRSMLRGLLLLALASALGALSEAVWVLLACRALEGLGLLLVALPAPALIRRLVPPERLPGMLGFWGAYMPAGTALALLLGPLWLGVWGWRSWWLLLAGTCLLMAAVLWRWLPPDPAPLAQEAAAAGVLTRLRRTLGHTGPWLVALCFGLYSGQWLAVVGFLPAIYTAAGLDGVQLGLLTALAAAVNMLGNMASGRLLLRGWAPRSTLWLGFAAMAVGSTLAFVPWTEPWPWLRYAGVLVFSGLGGLVPGTLFGLAVRLAPGEQQVAATVGWVQQLSALGQFMGPPAAASLAAHAGGWQLTPLFTVACCVGGLCLAALAQRRLQAQSRA